jgi:acetylornithine/succinyldiaminopimelate/putrescine aminotransferase
MRDLLKGIKSVAQCSVIKITENNSLKVKPSDGILNYLIFGHCYCSRVESLKTELTDAQLLYRSAQMGEELRNQLNKIQQKYPNYIKEVRGRGLFNAVELNSKNLSPVSAYDICLKLKERGVLAKPTHDTIIRLTPPLSIR